MSIYNELKNHSGSDFYPFHMPGHKRNTKLIKKYGLWDECLTPYDIDITEIDNFDNLHNPEGIIKEAERLAARLYGARESIYSVNGSTGAILAVLGLIHRGEAVLMARNCHKSVYHGVELYGLVPYYLEGETDSLGIYLSISPKEVEEALRTSAFRRKDLDKEGNAENPNNSGIKLVVITSPTYEGVVSDIADIADICHRYGAFLLVDEAHGAHFGFDDYFPASAVSLGADFVVQSLHKTLPSFTQTAILHICTEKEKIIDKIRRQFNLLETSSPSYIFLAGMESSLNLIKDYGRELFDDYKKRLISFREGVATLKNIRLYAPLNAFNYDYGKLVITAGDNLGSKLYRYLYDNHHLVMEMKSKDYVIAMTSIFDTDEGFYRLLKALTELDRDETFFTLDNKANFDYTLMDRRWGTLPERKYIPFEAVRLADIYGKYKVSLDTSQGLTSADYVYFYPPGIPLLVPGEVIEENVIRHIKAARLAGIEVYGGIDGNGIFVCADGQECNR
jgi:hypothetical protein